MSEQICVWPQKMLFFWLDTSLSMLLMLPRGYRGSQVHGDFVRAFPFFCDIIATFLIIRINMLHWIEFFFLENFLLWRASLSFEGKYCSHWITSGINWTCDFHKAYQYSCLPHLPIVKIIFSTCTAKLNSSFVTWNDLHIEYQGFASIDLRSSHREVKCLPAIYHKLSH